MTDFVDLLDDSEEELVIRSDFLISFQPDLIEHHLAHSDGILLGGDVAEILAVRLTHEATLILDGDLIDLLVLVLVLLDLFCCKYHSNLILMLLD